MTRIGVGGVLSRGDQILLGKRSAYRTFYPGVWDIVGGHRREGETPEQTLARELTEELGIVPVEYRLLAIIQEPKPEVDGEGSYYVYLVTKWNGIPRNLREDEHSELAWVGLDEVDRFELALPSYATLFRSIRSVS
jgi:8-oxo-dGTP diphosphatase